MRRRRAGTPSALPIEDLPVLVLFDGWNSFFRSRVVPWRMALAEKTRNQLEARAAAALHAAPALVRREEPKRSNARRDRRPRRARRRGPPQWLLAIADTEGTAGAARYFVPLAIAFDDDDEERTRALAPLAVAKVRQQAKMGVLADAMADEPFCRALVEAIGAGTRAKTDNGRAALHAAARPMPSWSAMRSTARCRCTA